MAEFYKVYKGHSVISYKDYKEFIEDEDCFLDDFYNFCIDENIREGNWEYNKIIYEGNNYEEACQIYDITSYKTYVYDELGIVSVYWVELEKNDEETVGIKITV